MKAPVEHFTRAASKEFGSRGISVTAVAPGPMDTPFFMDKKVLTRWLTTSRLPPWGDSPTSKTLHH
ncbi:SDR family oxidoreductase [Dyadobacter jiangsuensis]|uniref:SDR family oxidoreductase n=1 Tax=Dyadobacter jiangsuensis TaxID=1591085 RepID=UPI001E631892|nr:SDR family oxidoreductase [Dyadobacter jiangsuensis]